MPPHGVLPLPAPTWRPGRSRMKFDWAGARAAAQHVASPNKSEGTVIEIVDAEIVDDRSTRTPCHVGIQMNILAEKSRDVTLCLIGVISPHHSRFSLGVVRFANAGEQQHADVVQSEGGQKHQASRLLEFSPL